MNTKQQYLGVALALTSMTLGSYYLSTPIFFRLLLGLSLGYVLVRGSIGFAGSVNRAYKSGSTRLMVVLMGMFVGTAIINAALVMNAEPGTYNLWVNPINTGLIVGGLLFGFGMSFSSCCATGVLARISSKMPLALITLFFFCLGVFAGFPIQKEASWITDTWVSSASYPDQGVYLPDLIPGDPLNGYLSAIVLTVLFASIVVYLAKRYEDHRRQNGSFFGTDQDGPLPGEQTSAELKPMVLFSRDTYETLLVKPWSMRTGAIAIIALFTIMMASTGNGWGASTPFGLWFGKWLMFAGFSAADVAAYTRLPETAFTLPFFEHGVSVQNLGIVIGAISYLLMAGKFKPMHGLTLKDAALFAIGGLAMGLGTRFANGCNVGALYTPIANLSLSGWIYLIFLVAGGVLGNRVAKAVT
ncbi:YeeE/YedE family protein [Endozoicomonas arenosclerae]|uniref:YeeE/YedE family protein n=1 Tax=Endozoicomonas arenosclerae TaxID=1633495 RepID=UPI0007860829|nr:YeeE/YedE family protein [Endozoicomonas arenosclerae]